ncbi:response regulator transcription factor [Metallumcola ferriviriculae]|uniref:Stage 0 sporulation protein A homolog n=1 Tax=Metallumcola ferriviriculae TaxID=3039180 RepID=A0AAU0UWE8_9FIRM|nr:response regulator transcription factor [Desulfitibacteraceae bacterium MK1]
MNVIRILIADDHALIRQGLGKILSMEPQLEVVAEAANGTKAVDMTREFRPDVVLMDINMPGMNGLEATRIIKGEFPLTEIIALTIHDDEEYVFEMVNAGVSGYVLKDIDAEILVEAVKDVVQGKSIIHPSITTKILDKFQQMSKGEKEEASPLTPREMEVLTAITMGLSNKEIGDRLFISDKTVKNHITNIFRKLNVSDRTQAAVFALKHNIIKD